MRLRDRTLEEMSAPDADGDRVHASIITLSMGVNAGDKRVSDQFVIHEAAWRSMGAAEKAATLAALARKIDRLLHVAEDVRRGSVVVGFQ